MSVDALAIFDRVKQATPCFWVNEPPAGQSELDDPLGVQVQEATDRLHRSCRLLANLFPAISGRPQPLRSPLLRAPRLGQALGASLDLSTRMWVKADHELPVAGSVKARGGFHEIIAVAERIALREGLIAPGADLAALASEAARNVFSGHSIVVGSTGNLGMSIGLMASALGFRAIVHMSSDAKAWKKDRLREHGAQVVEHSGDYAQAVLNGRRAAEADPLSHFVDDERSTDLFVGYAAVADELVAQLRENDIKVDGEHPLFVYIPCGVGGAPGGISYGLKRRLGPDVHCIFAEPVQSPCMLVQLAFGQAAPFSVYDLGLTNRTEADGLAVGQASMLVASLMRERLDAIYTLSDDQLYELMRADARGERFGVEPSAAAAFAGPLLLQTAAGRAYLERYGLDRVADQATHVMWTTGGSLVPQGERNKIEARAAQAGDFSVGNF